MTPYSYDRTASSKLEGSPIGTVVSYQEGEGFGVRYLSAIRAKHGWVGVHLSTVGGSLQFGELKGGPVDERKLVDAEEGDRLAIIVAGVRPGELITQPVQLQGLPPGASLEDKRGNAWQKLSDGKWQATEVTEEKRRDRETHGVRNVPVEYHNFDSAIKQPGVFGLRLKHL